MVACIRHQTERYLAEALDSEKCSWWCVHPNPAGWHKQKFRTI